MFSDSLADLPRECRSLLGCLRTFREAIEAVRDACGAPARLPKPFETLADVPRGRPIRSGRLRGFRETAYFRRRPRGMSARPSGGGRESLWFDFVYSLRINPIRLRERGAPRTRSCGSSCSRDADCPNRSTRNRRSPHSKCWTTTSSSRRSRHR